jgi:hypothetical protein
MKVVPPLPKAFDRWLDREPLKASRYGYYHRLSRSKATCFCTHCKQDFVMERILPTHNQDGVCPCCGFAITFKAEGLSKSVRDTEKTAVLQHLSNGGYLLRFFTTHRFFMAHYRHPKTESIEESRLFFTEQGVVTGQYKMGNSNYTGRYGWYPTKDNLTGDNITWNVCCGVYLYKTNVWFEDRWLYPHNIRPALQRMGLNYGISSLLCGKPVDVTTALLQSIRYPFGHLLAARGMDQLIQELYSESKTLLKSRRVGKLHQCLGIPKNYLEATTVQLWGVKDVNWLATAPRLPSLSDLAWLQKEKLDYKTLNILLQYTSYHRIRKYTAAQNRLVIKQIQEHTGKERLPGERQLPRTTTIPLRLGIWKDYLQMSEKIGRDVRSNKRLFPKDLQLEHDIVQQLVKVEMNKNADAKIQSMYQSLAHKYSYENQQFMIRPPRNFQEFMDEGNYLDHCVARNGYYNGHINGEGLILFLRDTRASDTPYYTLEVDPHTLTIKQCYGHRHARATPEIAAFLEEWKAYCEKSMQARVA